MLRADPESLGILRDAITIAEDSINDSRKTQTWLSERTAAPCSELILPTSQIA
jgi:hypothetical protein